MVARPSFGPKKGRGKVCDKLPYGCPICGLGMRWGTEDYSEWDAKRLRWWRRRRLFTKIGLVATFLAAFAAAWKYLPPSADLSQVEQQWRQERSAPGQLVYYPNCAAARAAGMAPIHIGQPGYRPALDADNDGIACEPIPNWMRWRR